MNNSVCPEVLEEVAALPAASLARLAAAREYSGFVAELSPETLRHLPNCDFCHEEIALLAGASVMLGALPAPALPPDFAARIIAAIADVPQDAAEVSASPETLREYSRTPLESALSELSAPDDAPAMIAPPLQRTAKRNWRARFGLEKIGGAPRRNMKVAWASGSVLAAFVLILATQIESPSMFSARRENESAVSERAPLAASTREGTSAKSGVQKDAAQSSAKAPFKPNAPKKIEAPRTGVAPQIAQAPSRDAMPLQNVPRDTSESELVAPPANNSGDSAPRIGLAPPALPLRRAVPKSESAAPLVAPPSNPSDAARKTSPSAKIAHQEKAPATQPRVLAHTAPHATASTSAPDVREPKQKFIPKLMHRAGGANYIENDPARVPANAAPPRDDSARSSAQSETFAPPAAVSGAMQNREAAAPPSVASTRDMARSTPKMRGDSSAEDRAAAASNDSADLAAPSKTDARSSALAAPVAKNRVANAPISLHIALIAPRDIERARLRLELPRGAQLQDETPNHVIWSGTLKRGENAVADVKIITDETVASHRARAILESRERDGWRIVATKSVEWKAP